MKVKFIISIVSFLFLFTSCSSVKVDYEKHIDFSRYKTFAYIKDGIGSEKLPVKYKKIIVYEIDRFIKEENLQPDVNHPDLLVLIEPDFHKRYDVYAPGIYHSRKSYEGSIIIKFIDAKTNRPIWTGKFYLNFSNSGQLRRYIRKKLSKLADKYPPYY